MVCMRAYSSRVKEFHRLFEYRMLVRIFRIVFEAGSRRATCSMIQCSVYPRIYGVVDFEISLTPL